MESWFIWTVLAFIFLNETISLKQTVGLFFALTAIVLLSS